MKKKLSIMIMIVFVGLAAMLLAVCGGAEPTAAPTSAPATEVMCTL